MPGTTCWWTVWMKAGLRRPSRSLTTVSGNARGGLPPPGRPAAVPGQRPTSGPAAHGDATRRGPRRRPPTKQAESDQAPARAPTTGPITPTPRRGCRAGPGRTRRRSGRRGCASRGQSTVRLPHRTGAGKPSARTSRHAVERPMRPWNWMSRMSQHRAAFGSSWP